ncbi:MAG: hypothetical protein EZS28_024549 [Streblomastix strix]|uniref:Uncharacterized protein n=1 Tax=Streblomastix strix TaxID=222440 RepID=A0A5J4VBL7_9EUKA|nr:MAG: hypothetical protein EZS28_024549 [Streblomastix strix]
MEAIKFLYVLAVLVILNYGRIVPKVKNLDPIPCTGDGNDAADCLCTGAAEEPGTCTRQFCQTGLETWPCYCSLEAVTRHCICNAVRTVERCICGGTADGNVDDSICLCSGAEGEPATCSLEQCQGDKYEYSKCGCDIAHHPDGCTPRYCESSDQDYPCLCSEETERNTPNCICSDQSPDEPGTCICTGAKLTGIPKTLCECLSTADPRAGVECPAYCTEGTHPADCICDTGAGAWDLTTCKASKICTAYNDPDGCSCSQEATGDYPKADCDYEKLCHDLTGKTAEQCQCTGPSDPRIAGVCRVKDDCTTITKDTRVDDCPCPTEKKALKADPRSAKGGLCAAGSMRAALAVMVSVIIIPALSLFFWTGEQIQ